MAAIFARYCLPRILIYYFVFFFSNSRCLVLEQMLQYPFNREQKIQPCIMGINWRTVTKLQPERNCNFIMIYTSMKNIYIYIRPCSRKLKKIIATEVEETKKAKGSK